MSTRYRLNSLDEALAALREVQSAETVELGGPITLYQTLIHLSQSIECSLRGYPQMKPAWMRATVGPAVSGLFFLLGRMKHNLAAPVPGEPAIEATGDLKTAWNRLFAAIASFQQFNGPTRDHFMFGTLSKSDYSRLHALHIADHLSALKSRPTVPTS